MIDALGARAVTASLPAPPASPVEGACYRVTAPATEAWTGQEHKLAIFIGGAWRFLAPAPGWLLFDRAAGRFVIFRTQWQPAEVVAAPTGGTVVDLEARAALTALIAALQTIGVLGAPAA